MDREEEIIRDCYFGDLNDQLFQFSLPEDLPPATEAEKKDILYRVHTKNKKLFGNIACTNQKNRHADTHWCIASHI